MLKSSLSVLAAFLVASCSLIPSEEAGQQDRATNLDTPPTGMPELPTPSVHGQVTHAANPAPPEATRTAFPIVSIAQQNEYWMGLIENNVDCDLPCWLGITPGTATYADFDMLFAPIGAPNQEYPPSSGGIWRQRDLILTHDLHTLLYSVFSEQDGTISRIDTYATGPYRCEDCSPEYLRALQTLSVESVFARYGSPTRILLSMYTAPPEPTAGMPYFLWLLYDDQGISLAYEAEGLQRAGEDIRVCLAFETVSRIILAVIGPPDATAFNRDVAEVVRSGGPPLLSIHEATGLQPSELVQLVLNNPADACFATPVEAW